MSENFGGLSIPALVRIIGGLSQPDLEVLVTQRLYSVTQCGEQEQSRTESEQCSSAGVALRGEDCHHPNGSQRKPNNGEPGGDQ
jgi:hypothetical protein